MSGRPHRLLAEMLDELEQVLRAVGCWAATPPTPAALASTEPFALDTLEFPQWLQFIFVPKMRELAVSGAVLPGSCNVAPMAELTLDSAQTGVIEVIAVLQRLDGLLNSGGQSAAS